MVPLYFYTMGSNLPARYEVKFFSCAHTDIIFL